MGKRRIYLKEWRAKKGYTLDQVVDRLAAMDDPLLPKTGASLSRLENRKQPYSERILEALADIYGCEPEDLLGRDPTKDGVVIDMMRAMDERQQKQAIAILSALMDEQKSAG